MARTYQDAGQYDKAIDYFQLALAFHNQMPDGFDPNGRAHTTMQLTNTYISDGQYDLAETTFSQLNRDDLPHYFYELYDEVSGKLDTVREKDR